MAVEKSRRDRQRQLIPLASAILMRTLEHEESFFKLALLVVFIVLLRVVWVLPKASLLRKAGMSEVSG